MEAAAMGYRLRISLCLAALVPLGLATRFLPETLMGTHAGGFFYAAFAFLLLRLAAPARSPRLHLLCAITFCLAIELTQLSGAAPLVAARASFLGRTILGERFDGWDIPWYAAGALAAWRLDALLDNYLSNRQAPFGIFPRV